MAYKVLIVEDQDIPRQLFEIYIKASEKFEHLLSISNASAALLNLPLKFLVSLTILPKLFSARYSPYLTNLLLSPLF